jgi:hypothetical protein
MRMSSSLISLFVDLFSEFTRESIQAKPYAQLWVSAIRESFLIRQPPRATRK